MRHLNPGRVGASTVGAEPGMDPGLGRGAPGKRTLTESLPAGSESVPAAGRAAAAGPSSAPSSQLSRGSAHAGAGADAVADEVSEDSATKIGGDPTSKKVVRVAWTMDDGPTAVTGDMRKALGNIPATWYIMRNQIEAAADPTAKLAELKTAQDGGSEIAIHGLHKTKSHLAWFPSKSRESYPSIDAALTDLEAFYAQLTGAGIRVRFVRLPYGEVTEVTHLLATLGMADEKLRGEVARMIIRGEDVSKHGNIATSAKAEWEKFTAKLAVLGLHNWGGAGADKPEISVQSWEAESSGTGLTDNVTASHGGKVKANEQGKFERLVDSVKEGEPRSLVVLAHDTDPKRDKANITEVKHDIERMNSYASSKQVRVEYYTMSELFMLTRGKDP